MPSVVTPATVAHSYRLGSHTIMVVIALVAGCAAGVLVTVSVADAIRAYRATHHQVVAQVVEEKAIVAQVTWKDEAGVQRTGQVRTPLDHVSDTRARIWLDRQGRPAPRPFGPVEIVFGFLVAGTVAGGVTWMALWQARSLAHRWVARKAVKDLDERWRDYARNG
ncbi:hypothetical protein [Nonomuraea sp. NPDC049784]|uniref:hypothetical protein n=1 Tax=Nonomuraea sp. NPDC049784 TaxID=3154361 RepID=UPI00340F6A13